MAYINLLPWRESQRKEKQKEYFLILFAVSLLTLLLVFGVSLVYAERVAGQLKRNDHLNGEIALLDKKITEIQTLKETKSGLQQRMVLIEQLQSSRNSGTLVFSEIATVVPAGIYFSELEKKGEALLVSGRTESNNRLSRMIRQVEQSSLLSFVNLQSIVAGTNQTQSQLLSDFVMQLKVNEAGLQQDEKQ